MLQKTFACFKSSGEDVFRENAGSNNRRKSRQEMHSQITNFLQNNELDMNLKRRKRANKINQCHFKPICKHCAGAVLIGKAKRCDHRFLKCRVCEELRRHNMKLIYVFETPL